MSVSVDTLLEGLDLEEIKGIAEENSSFRGYLQGYIAELRLKAYLLNQPCVERVEKIPDQSKKKGDFIVTLTSGKKFSIELKSLDSNSIKFDEVESSFKGRVRLKRSDPRRTNSLTGPKTDSSTFRGEFDVLAVNAVQANGKWAFYFMHNKYIPSHDLDPGKLVVNLHLDLRLTPCLHSDILRVVKDLG